MNPFRLPLLFCLVCMAFNTPACPSEFVISLIDSATRQPVAARVYVENVETGKRHFVRAHSTSDGVIYERQNWANKNSIEHHTSVPAAPFVAENLPAGTYLLTIERGKEYFTETRRIVLAEGESRPTETVELRRWVNMAERGWYSGETHLHRPLNELPVVVQAEDLNVAMPLTYWVTKAFTAPSQGNKNQSGEIPDQLIMVDSSHAIWPSNTEYEIFTVNEHQHTLGALFVLNHRSVLDLGAPDWKPIADRARAEGALLDMDKLDWPFAMTLPHTTGATLYELANNHMWRTEFGLTKWNTEAPAFLQPPNGGTGGDERDWLAYTLGQYYTLLNAGFPLVPTAGTASGVHPVPAGFSRVYVPLEGRFAYEDWLIGLRDGRSFVTTGPMLFAKVNDQHPGATLSGDKAQLSAQILSEFPLKTLEVVQSGRIIALEHKAPIRTSAGAYQTEVAAEITSETSGWVCIRCTEDRPDGRLRFAHSAPWRIEIPDKPLRLTQLEKDYLVRRVQQEIVRSTGILPDSAIAEYQAALHHFESLPVADARIDDPVAAQVETITPEFTAIVAKDAGLWPQIQVTSDGTLLALGYNAAAHTTLPGDVECWGSSDGGQTWSQRGIAAPRPTADANYCHWASGFTEKNELLVIASGMDDAANANGQRASNDVRVFRSTDFGKSWTPGGEFPKRLPGDLKPYPFGSIVRGHDESLHTIVYTVDEAHGNTESAWSMISRDAGLTWAEPLKIAEGINESVLLPLAGQDWLCVARTSNRPAPELGQELRQFRSTDDGRTWTDEGLIAGYHKHPPHLLRLQDNRLLLTYGNRQDGSIEARLSANNGRSWDTPHKLYTTGPGDMGYPSTAQLSDGKLVTVFYAAQSPLHAAYHMGAIVWSVPIAAVVQATRRFDPPKFVNYRQPERDFSERTAGGWTFQLERELVLQSPEAAERVVQRLETNLTEMLASFPEHTRESLRQVTIFVMLGEQATGGGRANGGEYFRRIDPDFHPHLDTRWRNAVVIYSAANYLQQNDHWAKQVLVHEFAHAWHLDQWPEQQPEIYDAWQSATQAKLYRNVKDTNGTVLDQAYAAHNQMEYFAELTCAYFHRGEYEPFDRAALQAYDPTGFAMIETMWGIHLAPPPRSERAGR